ncbi:hypothetical protein QDY65_01405 [Pyrococcus kukulkanii]|uniref:hypothetical protein n=1 Tax=Pyrococcus kukulkanii TaxID=1609559 RepID=UPI003565F364
MIDDFITALEGKDSHQVIIAFLEALKDEITDIRIRQTHNAMLYLRALRNAADYDLREKPKIKTAKGMEEVDFSSKRLVQKA